MYNNKENDKLVSVIIPVYNAEKYLRYTLDSVIEQDYPYKEIIIVDDCSTDRSYEVVKEFQMKFTDITYLRLEENSGVAIARNKAIELASGRFIAFIDSDDIWESMKLSKQLGLFELYNGTPFTYTAISYIDEEGKQIKGKRNVKERVSYKYLLKNTMIATSSVIIDREVVNQIKMPNRRSAEDYSLWLSLLKQYGDAYGLDEALTRYRKSSDSLSSNRIGEVKYFYSVQTVDCNVNKVQAFINTICYLFNAVKKHFF